MDLPAHTYGRNRNSVALSCACMGGVPDPWTQPPTESQLNSLCAEAAAVAWGWGAEQITVERVMTHAEAASNRDGRDARQLRTVIWGGTGERWDLLSKNGWRGPAAASHLLREHHHQGPRMFSGSLPLLNRSAGLRASAILSNGLLRPSGRTAFTVVRDVAGTDGDRANPEQ